MEDRTSELSRIEKDLGDYLAARPNVIAAYLYGSRAAGRERPHSDADIAIYTTPFQTRLDSFHAKLEYQRGISDIIKKNTDIVFLQETGELLAYQIIKHGILVYEADSQMHRAFVARRMVQCIDFQYLQDRMQKGMMQAMRGEVHGQ